MWYRQVHSVCTSAQTGGGRDLLIAFWLAASCWCGCSIFSCCMWPHSHTHKGQTANGQSSGKPIFYFVHWCTCTNIASTGRHNRVQIVVNSGILKKSPKCMKTSAGVAPFSFIHSSFIMYSLYYLLIRFTQPDHLIIMCVIVKL